MLKRILGLLLVAGSLVGFYLNPLDLSIGVAGSASPIEVVTKARDLSLVCPGALYQAGGSSGTSLEVERVGESTTVGYFDEQPQLQLVEQRVVPDAPEQAGHVRARFLDAKSLTVRDPEGLASQGSELLSAMQFQKVALGNLSGLAATNCMRPTSDAWLVGGDTSAGRESLLILVNPSNVDSTVNLELFGPGGKVIASGLTSLSAPSKKTTVIPISSLAPGLATFTIHVESAGGAIGSWLQVRTVRGLRAGGVELIAPTIDPAKNLVIPGVFIRGAADSAKLIASGGAYADLVPVLRVQNPSSEQVTVTGQFLGTTASTYGTVVQELIPPGATIDIPVTGLADGDYVAFIDASSPVRAAIRLNRTKAQATDLAWIPAVSPTSDKIAASSPSGAITKLAIANPGKKTATVKLGGRVLKVAAGTSSSVVFAAGSSWFIESDQPVAVSAVVDIDGAFSVVPVIDFKNLGGKLAISVR